MENKIYLRELPSYTEINETQSRIIGRNPCFDLGELPTQKMREEMASYILSRSQQVCVMVLYSELAQFHKLCRFLQQCRKGSDSLLDEKPSVWMNRLKGWMFMEGIPISRQSKGLYGSVIVLRAKELLYMERVLEYLKPEQDIPEQEKDIWQLDRLDIPYRNNLIKNSQSVNFTRISQEGIREELKRGIYLNLQGEAIACVQKEMTAMRRLSHYLKEQQPHIQSCAEIDRKLIEEYLTYLKTEDIGTKHLHADLNRLRAILESIGRVCGYSNLNGLFLNRDIPPTRKAEFKTYSDSELKRLNAAIVRMDEQTARLMIIHQMLGTRISDTLTLETDCLYEKGGDIIIRIRQMKTNTYEKPVSTDLAALIRKAIQHTRERYGDTKYIFVDDKNPERPMQYGTIQSRIIRMIHEQDIRDDNGNLFGFGSHIYRHYYGVKLIEMHLDDWTIAKLLGHSSLRNVKYYRKMSNQILADDTRKARNRLSEIILENLDGWEEEYEQVRQDGGM